MKKAVTTLLMLTAFSYLYSANSKDMEANIQEEIWKDIPSLEGYYKASNLGRIKSLERTVWNHQCYMVRKERIIHQHKLKDGYMACGITLPNKKQKLTLVHRLVGLAFHKNPKNKPMINHKDGVKDNNNESNLEWATRSENAKHSFAMGLQLPKSGVDNLNSKMSEDEVQQIRLRYSLGESTYAIFNSGHYSVSYTNIKDIVARRTWQHI